MVVADQRYQMILPQRLGSQIAAADQDRRDREIEFAGRELIVQPLTLNGVDLQIETRRVAPEPCHERRQQRRLVQVDGRDAQRAGDLVRVKGAARR